MWGAILACPARLRALFHLTTGVPVRVYLPTPDFPAYTLSCMRIRGSWLFWLAAFPLSAATIDVSYAVTAQLGPGDSLVFDIPGSNYTRNAGSLGLGLPLYPTGISFVLISAASSLPVTFEAGLESADGSFSETLGAPIVFSPGAFSSSAYSGAVSTLEGFFQLTARNSEQIFGGPGVATGVGTSVATGVATGVAATAVLTLRNLGPPVVLGLPATTLRQDLFVSLSGVSLSGVMLAAGALPGTVLLQESLPEVPEPHSGSVLIAGGLLLCLAARPLKGISRRQTKWR
jgi:hypothetical protein